MTESFTRDELKILQRKLDGVTAPCCPRCGRVLDLTPIPPKASVAYVRNRVLFQCGSCKLRGLVDRK